MTLAEHMILSEKLSSLWNTTSDDSLVRIVEHLSDSDWGLLATETLLARHPLPERLIEVMEHFPGKNWEPKMLPLFETELLTHTLNNEQIRNCRKLECLTPGTNRTLWLRMNKLEAMIEELIHMTGDVDPKERQKATQEILKRELSYEEWEKLLRCWGDENHADVVPQLWKVFRRKFPKVHMTSLFEIAQWCPHVRSEVVNCYLTLKPTEITVSPHQAHEVYCLSALGTCKVDFLGALWVRESLDNAQQAKMLQKSKELLTYARKLENTTCEEN